MHLNKLIIFGEQFMNRSPRISWFHWLFVFFLTTYMLQVRQRINTNIILLSIEFRFPLDTNATTQTQKRIRFQRSPLKGDISWHFIKRIAAIRLSAGYYINTKSTCVMYIHTQSQGVHEHHDHSFSCTLWCSIAYIKYQSHLPCQQKTKA